MQMHGVSSVGIEPNGAFSIQMLKVETNSKKDQVTFDSIITHETGTIPEGTVISNVFTKAIKSKAETLNPIAFKWNPKSGLFSFTMEIDISPNSDVYWDYLFETTISSPDVTAVLTFKTKMSKLELGPKVELINTYVLDSHLYTVHKVTRDDGRKTKHAFPVGVSKDTTYTWDELSGELTVKKYIGGENEKLIQVAIEYSIGVAETYALTRFEFDGPVQHTKTLRVRSNGGFVKEGRLTFAANIKWASTGKAPGKLSLASSLSSGTNVPSGAIKVSGVDYNPSTGDLRATIKAIENSDIHMSYELGLLVTVEDFDPQIVDVTIHVSPHDNKYVIEYGEPLLRVNRMLLPFAVKDKDGNALNPALLNDYQQNPLTSKGLGDIKAPSVLIENSKTYLVWMTKDVKPTGGLFSALGIYAFGANAFLYDVNISLDPLSIESITTVIKGNDIEETLILSKEYPEGSIVLDSGAPKYETTLVQKDAKTVVLTFRDSAITDRPVERIVGAGLVFTADYGRTLCFHDQVKLLLTPGSGELIFTPILSRLVGKNVIEVVTWIHWGDETHPVDVKMDPVIKTPKGTVKVNKWEYLNKEGLLIYYVPVQTTGMKDDFEFTAIVSNSSYDDVIRELNTKVTVGSDFYPFDVGEVTSSLNDDNVVTLSFPVKYRNGKAVKKITEVLSVEETFPTPGLRKFSNFTYKKGTVSLDVELGHLNWSGSNYELNISLADDKEDDNSNKLAVTLFSQQPKVEAELDYAGLVHQSNSGAPYTEVFMNILRHDGGVTKSVEFLGGDSNDYYRVTKDFRLVADNQVGVIRIIIKDPNKPCPIKGEFNFVVDGENVTLKVDDQYRVPGQATFKEMKLIDHPTHPLEVTWSIGGWTSQPAEYISLNARLWKGQVNNLPGESIGEWDSVTQELKIKFPAVVDKSSDMRYTGNNVFMLPTPDMTVYPIEFDGVIEASEAKAPFFSARPNWNPTFDRETGEMEFRYKFGNTKGNSVRNVTVKEIKYYAAGDDASKVPTMIKQAGDSMNLRINPGEGVNTVIFDITFESDNAPNPVTVRDGFSVTGAFYNPGVLFAEILPKSDTLRVYFYNPGVETGPVKWKLNDSIRQAKTGIIKDERTNILYADFIVFMNDKQDVRYHIESDGSNGVYFSGIALIRGTNKPYNRLLIGQPKVKVKEEYIEYVYPARYEGTQIGPEDVSGEVIDQTGTFMSATFIGNATARTVTVRINKYPPPHPVEFKVTIRLQDGKANKPTTLTLDV